MSGRFIALGKQLGVHLVSAGETWRHLLTDCVLRFMGLKAINVCQDDQLCVSLKEAIESNVHGVQAILDDNSST